MSFLTLFIIYYIAFGMLSMIISHFATIYFYNFFNEDKAGVWSPQYNEELVIKNILGWPIVLLAFGTLFILIKINPEDIKNSDIGKGVWR